MNKILLIILLLIPVYGYSGIIIDTDFNDQSWGTLGHEAYWTMQATGGVDDTPAIRLEYSTAGTAGHATRLTLTGNEYWTEFDVKFTGTPNGGSKFVKFFGEDLNGETWNNINNTTFIMHYTGNNFNDVQYNIDCNNAVRYNGTYIGDDTATIVSYSDAFDYLNGAWHHFKAYYKRADSGVKNGEVKVWSDGVLKLHATGMNSNPYEEGSVESNVLKYVELGGYTNSNSSTWYMWVDNYYVGTEEKGATPSSPVRTNTTASSFPSGTTSVNMTLITDIDATCKYDSTAGVDYATMASTFTTTGGTSHAQTITGLSDGDKRTYYVRCNSGEVNTDDLEVSFQLQQYYNPGSGITVQ